uniref:Uncharacterized protein n=1 Tax=Amphimedon queenslandica TaxID=400682 RepID=A0A1X7VHJ7_AMPQE
MALESDMSLFLKPTVESLKTLYNEGYGETHKIAEYSFCHVYPYHEDNPCGPLRTYMDTCDTARSMELPVNGFKGLTWLSAVPGYNLIEGTSIDYMHRVLLGVCRQLLRLWLQSENHGCLYYLGSNHKLCAWLIHYSAAVVHGIFQEDFNQHHLLLIQGIYLLLKSEVTESDLAQSKRNMTINVYN